ncbi:hypothetical protein Lesp02_70600 [Lentzea sp. NBRC 105346]|uniref:hypothetical protein n=1 Tax=Lentzea sp. NBRC 105346 TaxID=3032205 RepID=UPI0024A3D06C|nr:hypothetical protein [Lentzea sp. NBRC 105346]GLZ34873.1 hypothetical protein Lesp02_70600 [Lentzea sp. NBRC 105346]
MPPEDDVLVKFLRHAAYGPPGDLLIVTRCRRGRVDEVAEIASLLGADNVRCRHGEQIEFFGRRVLLCNDDEPIRLRGMTLAGALITADAQLEQRFEDELRHRCIKPGAPIFRA